jgi:mannose/fructose-specific phosphotransferase system component IIA
MVNLFSSMRVPDVENSRKTRQESEYFKAVEEYGDEEAVFVLADMWGESIHSVKVIIQKIGDDIWL